jgi:lipid A ethanolaminephosphotransferase
MLGVPNHSRPMIRVETLVLIVTAWIVATANAAWWKAIGQGRDWSQPGNWLFMICCFITLVGLHFAVLAPFAFRRVVRPLLTLLVVVSAGAAWYMNTFAVMLDPTMIRNVLRTDVHEARELLNLRMIGWVLLCSALPLAYIWLVRLENLHALRALARRAFYVFAAFFIAVLAALIISRDLTSFMRNQREARYLITPGNYLYGLAVNSRERVIDVNAKRETIGADAHFVHVAMADAKPRVLVLVIGETARAANFSLLGYPRETNPELAKTDVIAFSNVSSCGTSTEISVPCMFSPWGRVNYDERRIRHSEGLLDVLARAGYAVKWLDNQSGCKGVCKGAGVEYEKLEPAMAPDLCDDAECRDEILARRLASEFGQVDRNTVFVLHMMGNHGPAYFRRYPAEFRRFLPDCATAELRKCSRDEVVNAYDNAILYTDHVLARVVRTLSQDPRSMDSAMIYVSDHGESLGERGLYLHGIPYTIAPDLQTRVPMFVWVSRQVAASGDVDLRCLRHRSHAALSHDNLFHSVLGFLDVETRAYRPALDIFDGCRGGATRSLVQSHAEPVLAR